MRAVCVVVLWLLLGTAEDVWACSCVPRSPCSMYSATSTVFLGRVLEVHREGEINIARIEVSRIWKGTVDPVVTVSNEAGTSCSFDFSVGQRFLVFGEGSGSRFRTQMCAGGGPLRANDPEPELPPPAGRVTGSVFRLNESFRSRDDLIVRMPGARIWLTVNDQVIETRADAAGLFRLDGVPAGTHTIHADVGPAFEAITQVALRSPSDCAVATIMPRPAGRISGTLTSADGTPVRDIELFAVPVTHDWSRWELSDTRTTRVREDGGYEFSGVKPGRYHVSVNVVYPPIVRQPFAPTYYPGVEDQNEAVVIEVGQGTAAPPTPFVLKRTLPRTTIEAEILCQDGSLPRSGLVFAVQADSRSYVSESTYERVDGRFRVTVMQGVSYDVEGDVLIPVRDANGREYAFRGLKTPKVRVDPAGMSSVIRLIAPLDRCQETTIDGSRRR